MDREDAMGSRNAGPQRPAAEMLQTHTASSPAVLASGPKAISIDGDANNSLNITGNNNIIQLPPSAPAPSRLHTIPAPVADFTGREDELKELRKLTDAGNAAICGLRGLGGVGKTELACKLAAELITRYPDAQIKLDLAATTTPLSPEEVLTSAIRAFHPEAKLPEDLPSLRNLYLSLLHGKRVLILADNARDATQVRPLLPPTGSLLLITSRVHFALEGLKAYNLDSMSEPDAQALLLKICPRIADHAHALAKACGNLPLALRAAASLLSVREDLSLAEYMKDLADETKRLEMLGTEGVDIGVEASLALSYRQLTPDTQRVFRDLSVFPATFDAPAEEAICQDKGHTHLSELLRLSLVDFDENDRRYHLHDLTRLFARRRLGEPGQKEERHAVHRFHASHYAEALAAANELYLNGNDGIAQGVTLFDRERSNIEAGQAWVAARATADRASAALANRYPNAGVYVLSLRLHARQWIQWLEAALAAARFLKEHRAEGTHLGNLGVAYAALGEPRKAIECHQQALVIDREIGNRRGEGHDLGNLGIANAALGEPRKAIEFYQQALAITRAIGDRRGEGNALGSLGNAYADLGEPRKAIEFYQQRLVIAREIGDRLGEGKALGNLGIAYKKLGEPRKAIDFYQHYLTIARAIGDRRGEGNALGNLGNANAALGETRKAIEFYQQQLAITREIGDRRGEGNALGSLGNAYADLGEPRKAIEFYQQQLTITREIGDRRGEGTAFFNMADELMKIGQRDQAIPLAQHALAIYRQIEDPHAAKVERTLAQWQAEAKKPSP